MPIKQIVENRNEVFLKLGGNSLEISTLVIWIQSTLLKRSPHYLEWISEACSKRENARKLTCLVRKSGDRDM